VQKNLSLKKEIKTRYFFILGIGATIGIGWVMVLGDWLEIAGPLGAILGFAGGTLIILIVGFCYAELASILPVAGGEVVYTYKIFGLKPAFIVSWYMTLAWVVISSFETISVAWIINMWFPRIKGTVLYSVRGEPIYLGNLLIGIIAMIVIIYINYRGLKWAAVFQEIFTYGLILFSLIFICAGIFWGKPANLVPLFSKTGAVPILGGILAILMTVPNWLSGFNIIPQIMEEKSPGIPIKHAVKMILVVIFSAGCFFMLVILSSSMATPWKNIIPLELPAVGAFEASFHSSLLAQVVLFAGMCGMIMTWNSVFIGGSRIFLALGRAHIIPPVFGTIHSRFGTPFVAVFFIGLLGTLGALLGRKVLLPIINVSASAFALAFLSTCLGVLRLRIKQPDIHRPYRLPGGKFTASIGAVSCLFMLLLSIYEPYVLAKGGFPFEWVIMIFWIVLGIIFWFGTRKIRNRISESEREKLILTGLSLSEKSMIDDISS